MKHHDPIRIEEEALDWGSILHSARGNRSVDCRCGLQIHIGTLFHQEFEEFKLRCFVGDREMEGTLAFSHPIDLRLYREKG